MVVRFDIHIFFKGYGRLGEVGDKTIEFRSRDRSGRPSVILTSKQADKTREATTMEKITYLF